MNINKAQFDSVRKMVAPFVKVKALLAFEETRITNPGPSAYAKAVAKQTFTYDEYNQVKVRIEKALLMIHWDECNYVVTDTQFDMIWENGRAVFYSYCHQAMRNIIIRNADIVETAEIFGLNMPKLIDMVQTFYDTRREIIEAFKGATA